MTLTAVWVNREEPEAPRLWMTADSRISDETGPLVDQGNKLFVVPVVCREPDPQGFYTTPFFTQTVGLMCFGGSLIYNNVYASVVPLVTSLIGGPQTAPPSLEELADVVGTLLTEYVRELGIRRGPAAARVGMVVGGFCARHSAFEAHELRPGVDRNDLVMFARQGLGLTEGEVHFFGDALPDARASLERRRGKAAHPIVSERAPQRVVEELVASSQHATIGGDVQLGFTVGMNFQRVATTRSGPGARTTSYMNNIDIDAIGHVGPCAIGMTAMA